MTRVPKLELLWWEGCPSTDRALSELRAAVAERGLDGAEISVVQIHTAQDAARTGFVGSPTILIDGVDVVPLTDEGSDGAEPTGLGCRVYRLRDGRVAPTPDPDDVREALRAAAADDEVKP